MRAQILIIPVLTLWLPFFKLVPLLYIFRVNSLLKIHYAALRDAETKIEQADSREQLLEQIEELETLRRDLEDYSRKMPAYYQRHIYQWRLHVTLVQAEAGEYLQKIVEKERSKTADSGEPISPDGGGEEP